MFWRYGHMISEDDN